MDMNMPMNMDPLDSQIAYNPLELDLMKRAMDHSSYDPSSLNPLAASKKPRYNSSTAGSSLNGAKTAPPNNAAFENYGYGPSSSLYTTQPSHSAGGGTGLNAMTTPNSAPATTAAPPSPYVYGGGMNMNPAVNMMGLGTMGGMGMPMGMGLGGMTMNIMSPLSPLNTSNFAASGQPSNAVPYSPVVGGFPSIGTMGMPLTSPSLGGFGNVPVNMGVPGGTYTGAVAAAAAAAANNATGRTVYIGSLPPDASVDELLNQVHFGPIESIRVLPSKSCVFISFLDGATAAAFHADATIRKLSLHGHELKIGWGKASPVPAPVLMAISQSGASRNVYLGGLDEGMTEEQLRDDLSRFGLIDQVKIVRDKNIGFVHFLSIATATKVVATLPTEPAWAGKRVNYGKDRCAYIPKSQQAAAAAAQVAAAQSLVAQQYLSAGTTPSSATFGEVGNPSNPFPANLSVMAQAAVGTSLNRTIYLGNISPETTTEDLCNAIRGGVLQSIRYLQDKHIAFVTFIDPAAAIGFFQAATFSPNPASSSGGGLTINGRRVKLGWGKNSGPLPTNIAVAVHAGATRNVYVGNIGEGEWEIFNEAKLRQDFGEYGDIELVNYLREKNCAFVNFTNIQSAIKAIEAIKGRTEYATLRISYGKDRCANPPRMSNYSGGGGGGRRSNRENSGNGTTNTTNHNNVNDDAEGGETEEMKYEEEDPELADGMADVDAYTRAEVESLVDA